MVDKNGVEVYVGDLVDFYDVRSKEFVLGRILKLAGEIAMIRSADNSYYWLSQKSFSRTEQGAFRTVSNVQFCHNGDWIEIKVGDNVWHRVEYKKGEYNLHDHIENITIDRVGITVWTTYKIVETKDYGITWGLRGENT